MCSLPQLPQADHIKKGLQKRFWVAKKRNLFAHGEQHEKDASQIQLLQKICRLK